MVHQHRSGYFSQARSGLRHDHEVACARCGVQAEFCRLLLQSHRLRFHLRVRAAGLAGRLLAAGILQFQPCQSGSAQPLSALHSAGLHSRHHDERVGRGATAGHRRTAPHAPRQRLGSGVREISGDGGHLYRGADVFLHLQSDRSAALGNSRRRALFHQLFRLLVCRPGDAGYRHGGQFPHQQPHRRLHPRPDSQRTLCGGRSGGGGDGPLDGGACAGLEPRRAFFRFWAGDRQPLFDGLFSRGRDGLPVCGHGAYWQAALVGAAGWGEDGGALPDPFTRAGRCRSRGGADLPVDGCAGRSL